MKQSLVTAFAAGTISDPAIDAAYATRPDLYTTYAREKCGVPEGWRWFEVDSSDENAPPGMMRMRGAVYRKGPRSGRLSRVKGTERTLFINMADVRAFDIARANALGKCCNCWGTGMDLVGSSNDKSLYRKCDVCGGTGKPAEEGGHLET